MQLIVDIQNDSIVDKIIKILNVFQNDGVKIRKKIAHELDDEIIFDDEYVEKNWENILSEALVNYDESYYKSDQYKLDRGEYLMEKYK